MKPIVPFALLALALLPGCQAQRDQLKQALSGQPPVTAGSLHGDWLLSDLNGGGAPQPAITLTFEGGDQASTKMSGRVNGNSGCNRFSGGWQQDGQMLIFGPVASTQMGCALAVMAVEQRFVAVLADVTRLMFTENGDALLATADGRRLRLRRPQAAL